jgi:hypothetical protein
MHLPPKNRAQMAYSPIEASAYLTCIDGKRKRDEGSCRRHALENYWIEVGLIPVSIGNVYKARKRFNLKQQLGDWWNERGKKRLLPLGVVKEKARAHVENNPGLALGPDAMVDAMKEHKTAEAIAQGLCRRCRRLHK